METTNEEELTSAVMATPSLFELVGVGRSFPHIFENSKLDSAFLIIRASSKEEENNHNIKIGHFVNVEVLSDSLRKQIRSELQIFRGNKQ